MRTLSTFSAILLLLSSMSWLSLSWSCCCLAFTTTSPSDHLSSSHSSSNHRQQVTTSSPSTLGWQPLSALFLFRRRRGKNRYINQRDADFDYGAIGSDLPPSLASVMEIQQLERDCFLVAKDKYKCEHGWIDSVERDGAKLHYRRFVKVDPDANAQSQPPRGIIVWCHGIQGFGGGAFSFLKEENNNGTVTTINTNTALVAEKFVGQEGYVVYCVDLYGHGYSEGRRHYIRNWENNLKDYAQFVKVATSHYPPGTPLFCAGESYGGCLTIHLANLLEGKLTGILLLAPAIIPADLPPQPVTFILKQILARIAPRWQPFFMPHPVSPDKTWRDPRIRQLQIERATKPYIGGAGTQFRLGTAVQLLRGLDKCYREAIPNLETPFCVVHGDSDEAVPPTGTDYLWETAPSAGQQKQSALRKEPGAYHDLLADPSKDEVIDFLIQWTNQRVLATNNNNNNNKQ